MHGNALHKDLLSAIWAVQITFCQASGHAFALHHQTLAQCSRAKPRMLISDLAEATRQFAQKW
jgi:hypothetical protein